MKINNISTLKELYDFIDQQFGSVNSAVKQGWFVKDETFDIIYKILEDRKFNTKNVDLTDSEIIIQHNHGIMEIYKRYDFR